MNAIVSADLAVLDFIQEHFRSTFFDFVMPAVSSLANGGIFWIALSVVLLLFRRTRKYGLTMALALIFGALVCNVILKPAVARIRPYDLVGDIQLLIPRVSDFSFPSGHTTSSFAAASALIFSKARGRFAALALAVLIAFSRLYLYVHYPTDVLAGILIGLCAGAAAWKIVQKVWRRFLSDGQERSV